MPAVALGLPPTSATMPGTMGICAASENSLRWISWRPKISIELGRPISPVTVSSPLGAKRMPAVSRGQGANCIVAEPPP